MTHWFTADPHFFHSRIIELCKRPFANVDEMNLALIANYNKKVKTHDHLYILGDFGLGNIAQLEWIRSMIRCNNITFIWGNHDKELRRNMRATNAMFKATHDVLDIVIENQPITLFHYPIMEWNKFFYGAWHLYGHVHGNLSPLPGSLACDVGVDCHNFNPVSFEELKVIMENRKRFNAATANDNVKERSMEHIDLTAKLMQYD